jgi:hypothetical protein
MITKFKIFESISYPYKIGDFLLIKLRNRGIVYDNVLAKIIRINTIDNIKVKILDDRIEGMFKKDDKLVLINNTYIQCWSEKKEELEALINQNKYNL